MKLTTSLALLTTIGLGFIWFTQPTIPSTNLENQTSSFENQSTNSKDQKDVVEVKPQNQDLGRLVYGNIATTNFTITNSTPQTIDITRIATSCGCTTATVDQEKLEAYQSTTITVTFDPAVHDDDTDVGEVTRTVYLETSHPQFGNFENTITATVIKESQQL